MEDKGIFKYFFSHCWSWYCLIAGWNTGCFFFFSTKHFIHRMCSAAHCDYVSTGAVTEKPICWRIDVISRRPLGGVRKFLFFILHYNMSSVVVSFSCWYFILAMPNNYYVKQMLMVFCERKLTLDAWSLPSLTNEQSRNVINELFLSWALTEHR